MRSADLATDILLLACRSVWHSCSLSYDEHPSANVKNLNENQIRRIEEGFKSTNFLLGNRNWELPEIASVSKKHNVRETGETLKMFVLRFAYEE